jgi:hypothetical protein
MAKEQVVVAYAKDEPSAVRVEAREPSGLWHTFDLSPDEAEQLRDELDAALTDLRLGQVPRSVTIEDN